MNQQNVILLIAFRNEELDEKHIGGYYYMILKIIQSFIKDLKIEMHFEVTM